MKAGPPNRAAGPPAHEEIYAIHEQGAALRQRANRSTGLIGGAGGDVVAVRTPLGFRHGFGLTLLFGVFSLLLCLSVFAASASAETTHVPESFSPLDGSGSGVTIHAPSGIAIDEATHNVFLTDGPGAEPTAEPAELLILGGENGAPSKLAAPFSIAGIAYGSNLAAGLAYDNSASTGAETLYTYDPDVAKIQEYRRDGATEHYLLIGETSVAGAGTNVGLGIDGDGDLFLGSFTAGSVFKFSPSGSEEAKYEMPRVGGKLRPGQVAVDRVGDLFVQRQGGLNGTNAGVYKFPADGSGGIDPTVYENVVADAATGVAYDPATDHIYVALGNHVAEYDATTLEQIGPDFGGAVLTSTERIAVDSATGRIYVVDKGGKDVVVFGPPVPVPTVTATAASNVTGTTATLNGTVEPEGTVSKCFFEYGETTNYGDTAACKELPSGPGPASVKAEIEGLKANGIPYHYRLVAENENGPGRSADRTLTTAQTVVTQAASGVGSATATLNGYLRPEGLALSECKFEYKLTTQASFEEVECDPAAGDIDPDFAEHPVTAELDELQPNSTYEFRLEATNALALHSGETLTFDTSGPPQISELRARDATQNSVILEAKVNPSGFPTSWRFEWGATSAYGHVAPGSLEQFIGEGTKPVLVRAELSGLAAASAYHYRLVATSGEGRTTASVDQVAETLNTCGPVGLPERRCFEMVSPRNLGPIAAPGRFSGGVELLYQAAPSGPGALAYTVEGGLPDATRGGEVLYVGRRNAATGRWESSQYSPPVVGPDEKFQQSNPSYVFGLSPGLSCGVVASGQPLTDDPAGRAVIEAGGGNLYRRNPAGSPDGPYDLITYLPPLNADEGIRVGNGNEFKYYRLVAVSGDCSRVVFESTLQYPGIPGAGDGYRLYEWHNGVLSNLAEVPDGGGGEVPAEILQEAKPDRLNAVSSDWSHVFFTANFGGTATSDTGVFARLNGKATIEIARCKGAANPSNIGCARFQGATPDGSRVYFTANARLTPETSGSGQDLYEYDFTKAPGSRLKDLSVSHEKGGAEVGGLLGFADNGSHVYFAARAQLVPGRGNTRAQNISEDTYSVYDRSRDATRFVGTVTRQDIQEGSSKSFTAIGGAGSTGWTSRVSRDGRYLLFESRANDTRHPGSPTEAAHLIYLYDAAANSEPTVCVSCRQDGESPLDTGGRLIPLAGASTIVDTPLSLTVSDGTPRVFFLSKERLATGGRQGEGNLYEWAHGQIFLVANAPADSLAPGVEGAAETIRFVGASEDARDVYFFDASALNWENPEGRYAAWDVRIGGGFPQPSPPPPGCVPTAEASCQGAAPPPGAPGASSANFSGPGNVKPAKRYKKRHHGHHRRRHGRKHRACKKQHRRCKARVQRGGKQHHQRGGKHHARHANLDRRAGK